MATSVHHLLPNFRIFKSSKSKTKSRPESRKLGAKSVRCVQTGEKKIATVRNGNDSLDICRVLNGMWQTSGGWGRIDRDNAVDSMLRYADAGLSTFDMADHLSLHHPFNSLSLKSIKIKTRRSCLSQKICRKSLRCEQTGNNRRIIVKNGNDSLDISRVVNGMWQTSGGWGRMDGDNAVNAMLRYADAGFTTFDMADIYGPAEDLYGIFINKVRRERPPEFLEQVRGLTKWVPPPVKMTSSFVQDSINVSRKRMDVTSLDMLQFHWWDYSNPGYLDALKHLTDLKEQGKIKTVALTNFDTERLQIILENGIPVVSNQVQHSIVDMRPQQRMAELCQLTGVKLITYGTVMGGLLSEKFLDTNLAIPFAGPPLNTPSLQKYKRVLHENPDFLFDYNYKWDRVRFESYRNKLLLLASPVAEGWKKIPAILIPTWDVLLPCFQPMVDAWGGWSLFQVLLQTLKKVASKHGVSIPTVAVRYILDQPSVAGSMVGVRLGLSEHIQDANAVFSLVLDEEDVNSIQEVSKKGKDLLRVIGDCGDEYRRA